MAWLPGRPRNRPLGRTSVYRLFNSAGEILYIGCSCKPESRWKAHRTLKTWWPEVASNTVDWYDALQEAEAAERSAILAERPKYNIVYTPLHARICNAKVELTDKDLAVWMQTWPPGKGAPVNGYTERSKLSVISRNRIQQISEGRTGGKSKPTTPDTPES